MKDIAAGIESIVTAIGIIVGGYWSYMLFVKQRQKYPRAKIVHEIIHKHISTGKFLLRVCVTVSNIGDVLLSLNHIETRIQQMRPLHPDIEDKIKNVVPIKTDEIPWPSLDLKESNWDVKEYEVEPKEDDKFYYDFVLDSNIQTVEVYSYIRNVAKGGREIGWNLTTIYDLDK